MAGRRSGQCRVTAIVLRESKEAVPFLFCRKPPGPSPALYFDLEFKVWAPNLGPHLLLLCFYRVESMGPYWYMVHST